MEEEGGGMSLCGNCIEENGEGQYLKTCCRTPLFPLIKHDIQNTEDTLVRVPVITGTNPACAFSMVFVIFSFLDYGYQKIFQNDQI
jgi:hypothetical protein